MVEQELWLVANENAIDTVRTAYGDPGIVQTAHPTTCCYTVLLARPVTKVPHAIILNMLFSFIAKMEGSHGIMVLTSLR
jgi:hypothetical protein